MARRPVTKVARAGYMSWLPTNFKQVYRLHIIYMTRIPSGFFGGFPGGFLGGVPGGVDTP